MAELRQVGQACPIDDAPLGLEGCIACRFFRGVYAIDPVDGKFHGWKVLCLWPNDGRWVWQRPIPDSFAAAFEERDE